MIIIHGHHINRNAESEALAVTRQVRMVGNMWVYNAHIMLIILLKITSFKLSFKTRTGFENLISSGVLFHILIIERSAVVICSYSR